MLDRRERARSCPSVGAGDVDHVGECLGHAGCDYADSGRGDELDRDGGMRIRLLEVEDELGQVFDRVDVVVRRR